LCSDSKKGNTTTDSRAADGTMTTNLAILITLVFVLSASVRKIAMGLIFAGPNIPGYLHPAILTGREIIVAILVPLGTV
jgi:hypothetical protein